MNDEQIARLVDEVVARVLAQQGGAGKSGACACETEQKDSPAPPAVPAPQTMIEAGAARVGAPTAAGETCGSLSGYIDHTLLKPDATEADIEKLCREAIAHRFASVCVNTSYVEQCAHLLANTGVTVCCVVGFPLGAMTTDAKAFETRDAIRRGAGEIDMVLNVGKLQSGNYAYVHEDIRRVVEAAQGRTVKVILETSLLSDDEKIAACVLAKSAGAHFVKTSTGFGGGGATVDDIGLMRRIVGPEMGVKASGGIRDCSSAQQMVASGATRLGTSASVAIVQDQQGKGGY